MLELTHVSKVFRSAERDLKVLDDLSLHVPAGSSAAIIGPSGSGKTTLLGLAAGLDLPTSGQIRLHDAELTALNEEQRAAVRNAHVGFVFQNFQLIPTLTAIENVAIPLELRGQRNVLAAAREWLGRVGLADRAHHYPIQLSGGEQQRVAIARAMVSAPAVLFADEPTGNLDEQTSQQIEALLFASHRDLQNTLVMVTHDLDLAAKADLQCRLRNGRRADAA